MKQDEIIVVNYTIPVHSYKKVMELVQIRSKL